MLNEGPVIASKIRFEPITGQESRICTSLEVYRKRDDKEGKFFNCAFGKTMHVKQISLLCCNVPIIIVLMQC